MTLILDDDKHVVLNEGDVVVQRATIHGWKNEGTEWARMFFVMLRKFVLLWAFSQIYLDFLHSIAEA